MTSTVRVSFATRPRCSEKTRLPVRGRAAERRCGSQRHVCKPRVDHRPNPMAAWLASLTISFFLFFLHGAVAMSTAAQLAGEAPPA
uniref:Uncharacterized protein n=1 Tax=Oryza rufipogon TaxID=4529 RepID=A0A0E0NYU0_ORYRU